MNLYYPFGGRGHLNKRNFYHLGLQKRISDADKNFTVNCCIFTINIPNANGLTKRWCLCAGGYLANDVTFKIFN